MEIPHTVTARPDTGLYSSKLGIWLFLASEVMLFGGLFSAYIFLRLGSEPGYWPHGLLNVPVGTMNTAVLIASSVTVVFAWAALKMRKFTQYKIYMAITILCGILFLVVKLSYEWPDKFDHFGVFVKKSVAEKYDFLLGNSHLKEKGLEPRWEVAGHLLHAPEASPYRHLAEHGLHHEESHLDAEAKAKIEEAKAKDSYAILLDAVNADPKSPDNERPHFIPRKRSTKVAVVEKADVDHASNFTPRHSTYFATYFLITGLHGLHVLGGILVFIYFWLPIPGGTLLYRKNPEHLANRVEVAGLFWHFVDLVWIFVFPIFYLL
jgi:cytochrome c oxidase subunit 3